MLRKGKKRKASTVNRGGIRDRNGNTAPSVFYMGSRRPERGEARPLSQALGDRWGQRLGDAGRPGG